MPWVHHECQPRHSGQKHLSPRRIALEKLVLDVGIYSHSRRLGLGAHDAIGVGEAGKKTKISRAFVFRPLLRLDVEVNPVETVAGMAAIELDNLPHTIEQLVSVLARLIGVDARKEGLDADSGAMHQADQADEVALLRWRASRGERYVDLTDSLRLTEIPQPLSALRSLENLRALPHPEPVNRRLRRLGSQFGEWTGEQEQTEGQNARGGDARPLHRLSVPPLAPRSVRDTMVRPSREFLVASCSENSDKWTR
jgi:hypothetical protein